MNKCFFGDCRDVMRNLIKEGVKVQCIVTSPPYWGLRSYGIGQKNGELGLEATPQEYVERMVEVFRLVRELLADDGVLWLNLGDSYANDGKWGGETGGKQAYLDDNNRKRVGREKRVTGLKPKDLVGIPWRVAFALQADGWYLRQDIIWHKPNPMPESVTDRCTKSHEYLFLLSKSERYYFDNEAIKEDCTQNEMANGFRGGAYCNNETFDNAVGGKRKSRGNYKTPDGWDTSKGEGSARDTFKRRDSKRAAVIPGQSVGTHRPDRDESEWDTAKRNKRSVWTVATRPYKEAHFATFPPALIEPCILAGSRPGDIVFDPFFGSGTTGEVAERLSRRWIGAELNPAYEPLQKRRTAQTGMVL